MSPLDVAVLSNNRSLTKMLLQHGATEGNKCEHFFYSLYFIFLWFKLFFPFQFNRFDVVFFCNNTHLFFSRFVSVKSTDSLGNHLNNLLREAENRIQELSGIEDIPQAQFSTRSSFSSIIGKFRHDSFFFSFFLFLLYFNHYIALPRIFSIRHFLLLLFSAHILGIQVNLTLKSAYNMRVVTR